MTFTSTLPTVPGYFLWKLTENDSVSVGQVAVALAGPYPGKLCFFDVSFASEPVELLGGLWCRLVSAEEVEKAWMEGWEDHEYGYSSPTIPWGNSDAKRIAEGTE